MSNIYIQEPPTEGKVVLETTVGDIDIELWSKEAPKACRNFVQLCLEEYYNGTIFHRVIKEFIAQGGDPTGTGMGGESIYGAPFKDEFHSRLRFVRRGLVAMANAGKDDNGSQFFFTLGACPELQNKHTIFGKVAGDTLYNMLRFEDGLITDGNERPKYPHKIISTRVVSNPFKDIEPRNTAREEDKSNKRDKVKKTKNFKLLSFGDEAEEDDDETTSIAQKFRGKSKSSHDLANDPKLSSIPAIEIQENKDAEDTEEKKEDSEDEGERSTVCLASVKEKLKSKKKETKGKVVEKRELPESDDEVDNELTIKKKAKVEEIRKEIRKLKREMIPKTETEPVVEEKAEPSDLAVIEFQQSLKEFEEKRKAYVASKDTNEERTMAMMVQFRNQLSNIQSKEVCEKEDGEDDSDEEGWLSHKLVFEDDIRMAKDANVRAAEDFEIYDPRNPINQRRREASKIAMKEKKK